ncbi:hypothetical protein [Nocardiopsis metallicus]|uniref:Uncharacterized membrane protein YhaH (DUF805 family) n=1 Tax=Nocardiopsis metallicus TaxID=179819 RepID=A0A840WS61_9ACTN|nr:hypothetical protein [Nocardiopsis metallicus]MBB5494765.1 uncharacterized membrane protein YhaH (DUF805 family) [Nocardiopsis metallicus]
MSTSAQLWQSRGRFPLTLTCELPYWMVQLGVYLYALDLLLGWGAHPGLSWVAFLVALGATTALVPWQVWVLAASESVRRAQARGPYRPGPVSWIWALLIASLWICFWLEHPLAATVIVVVSGLVSLLSIRRSRETSKGWR